MSWEELTDTEKAILFLIYESESGTKGLLRIGGGKKKKGPVTLGALVSKKTQASYKNLVKICQGLEDRDYLIAGKKKGRDEPFWPENTPLRLVGKGKKFVQTNLQKYESDSGVQKELSKLAEIEFERKPKSRPKKKKTPPKLSEEERIEQIKRQRRLEEDAPPRRKKTTAPTRGKRGSMASEEFDVDDDYDEDGERDREDDAWDVAMGEEF
ncbi:MAG: hypothetical protein ACFFBD_24185 [Candidatus Hodarchaeota archaeon]